MRRNVWTLWTMFSRVRCFGAREYRCEHEWRASVFTRSFERIFTRVERLWGEVSRRLWRERLVFHYVWETRQIRERLQRCCWKIKEEVQHHRWHLRRRRRGRGRRYFARQRRVNRELRGKTRPIGFARRRALFAGRHAYHASARRRRLFAQITREYSTKHSWHLGAIFTGQTENSERYRALVAHVEAFVWMFE